MQEEQKTVYVGELAPGGLWCRVMKETSWGCINPLCLENTKGKHRHGDRGVAVDFVPSVSMANALANTYTLRGEPVWPQ